MLFPRRRNFARIWTTQRGYILKVHEAAPDPYCPDHISLNKTKAKRRASIRA